MVFRERKQIAICVTAAVMIAGFVLFRYLPLQRRIKAIKGKRAAQILAMTKASSESRRLPALKEELLRMQRAAVIYERQVPRERALGVFLQEIAGLMNEHNLREQLVQPGKEIEAGELNCIPVDMQCKGRLEQIFEFYKSLQKLNRLARIEQVKLVNDRDFAGEVSMQTKAIIYYRSVTEQG
jgi:Tfp pilus assembly protein PilO